MLTYQHWQEVKKAYTLDTEEVKKAYTLDTEEVKKAYTLDTEEVKKYLLYIPYRQRSLTCIQ
jgi:hypothetical protein